MRLSLAVLALCVALPAGAQVSPLDRVLSMPLEIDVPAASSEGFVPAIGETRFTAVMAAYAATANDGYEACRARGYGHSDCKLASGGYESCRARGYGHSDCLAAPDSYESCRARGYGHSDCIRGR